jgi:glucose/arabinose dehydrogenase
MRRRARINEHERIKAIASRSGWVRCSADRDGRRLPRRGAIRRRVEGGEAALNSAATIISEPSRKCLDVPASNDTPGTALILWTCHGQDNQKFKLTENGELRALGDRRCVQPSASSTPRTRAVIEPCNGQANQRWERRANGTIAHVQSGTCLDVEGARTADGTNVNLWACHGNANQRWSTDGGAPTPPTNLTVSDLRCNSATLSWSASRDDTAVAFYDIYHDGQMMKSVAGNVLSTSVTLVPGVTWGIYVNARDALGNVSQASATATVSVPFCEDDREPPTSPAQLTARAVGTTINLAWLAARDNVAVRAYDVRRNGVRIGTVNGNGSEPPPTFFVDAGLAANTSYSYDVVARDAQGNVSASSNAATARTGEACASPVCSLVEETTERDIPWGIAQLSDGTMLYSRRDAHDVILFDPRTRTKTNLGRVPNVQSTDGEGGLLGLAVAPSFDRDRWLYVMHTSPTDNRVVRLKVVDNRLDTSSLQVLVSGMGRNKYHNGGRLRIGPDGKLYAATGDAQNGDYAQDLRNLAGKILRINLDGSIPSDNPFGSYVWSYGHRNPQGLAFDSAGRLWAQEFGDGREDETNLIQRGGNYGYPQCEGTVSRSGQGCSTPGFIAPKRTYSTADASCSGITIVRDVLYVACLRGTRLFRAPIRGDGLPDLEQYFVGTYGRLRTVEATLDGNLWLSTSTTGDKDSTPENSNERIFRVYLRN